MVNQKLIKTNNKKKNKNKNKKNKLKETPSFYTKQERHLKISKIMLQIMMEDMNNVISDDIRYNFKKWIDEGGEYSIDKHLAQYSRTLEIRLNNDKSKDTHVCFKYNHIVIEGEVQNDSI